MPKTRSRTQQQRREAAQEAVLAAALEVFAEKGYQQASLEEIANRAGLTTRPVYHYFGNKQGLFAAVTEQLEHELALEISSALRQQSPIKAGWESFMHFCQRQDFRRIVLLDAPNVLGRQRWQESEVVKIAQQALKHYLPQSPEQALLLTRMLLTALAEAALVIAEQEDTDAFIKAANQLAENLLRNVTIIKPL